MKSPSNIGIKPWPYRPVPDFQKNNSIEGMKRMDRGPISFNRLLANSIGSLSGKGDLPNNKALPPGQDEILKLVEIIKNQMNEFLFSTLAESEEDSAPDKIQLDWINLPGIGSEVESLVPIIQHAPEKTTGIQSKKEIDHIINHASKKYDLDPDLLRAVIRAESDFDTNCTSHKGAMGLMQLMPETAKELGVKNPYDPVENIMAGTRYLKSLLDRYDGNIPLALAAYNWGMGNLERHPGRLPRETRTYISRVNEYYRGAKS